MNRRTFRSFRSWALTGVAAAAIASPAYAQEARRFEIPGQSLIAALEAFGKQGDAEILFSKSAAEGRSTQGLTGEYEPSQALALLLEGSGLKYRQVNANTYVVEAQDPQGGRAAGATSTVEALIVTAQKREEDIQDVPIAISAFSQEDLTRSQIAGGPDLITQVPNMTFTKTNFSSYSIQIRGIGTQAISATTDPAVAVAFNNTPFIRNRFFEQEFYDLQRVEVLRGPQGTLYGRNATAGVVNLISAKPKFFFEAKASGDISNYNSSRVEGMVNIPLVEDAVALRLAGAWTKRDGYAVNELSGAPIDGRDLWSTRVSVRFAPPDAPFDANLIWEHFEEDDDRLRSGKQLCKKHVPHEIAGIEFGPFESFPAAQQFTTFGPAATFSQGCERVSLYSPEAFQTPFGPAMPYYGPLSYLGIPVPGANGELGSSQFNPPDPYARKIQSSNLRVIESTVPPRYKASSDIGEFQLSWDLADDLTLVSETAYGVDRVWSTQDFNRFNTAPGAWDQLEYDTRSAGVTGWRKGVLKDGVFCDPQVGCADRLVAVDLSTGDSRQFSQEFRLASSFDGDFNFSLGANFLRYDGEDKYYVFINSLTLRSALAQQVNSGYSFLTWEPGVTDNRELMLNGLLQGDPATVGTLLSTYIDPNPIESVNDQGHNYFLSKNPYKLISYAIFGETYYNITENLKVTAGLRWSVDKKEAPRIPSWALVGSTLGYPVLNVIRQEWREPTGRLVIDWKPNLSFTDETLVYGSYAHGYKAGGANPPPYVPAVLGDVGGAGQFSFRDFNAATSELVRPPRFDAEFIDAYEAGTKNTMLDGRATLNLAAFYYDYKGYQVSEIVDRAAFNRNFDAEVWGVEIETDWRPLENLKIGLKGGYQKTRIADGEEAVDLMDRTAGMDGWTVVRPYPIYPSSCILPEYIYIGTPTSLQHVGNISGGGVGGCEMAYNYGFDPATALPYVPNPTVTGPGSQGVLPYNYPGFDPSTAPNSGQGFSKQLGGNELPNAPNWTATITGDYTVPLAGDWLMNLHTDLHWQAASYWRVFQDHEFNELDEYFTMNLAAIITSEERGWHIMAYVKNVTDETAITGAFLNSDDTGLTANVFLTEPRLYGLRVTKSWTGGPLLGSFGERHDGPYPLTVEVGGQVQRHDAPNALIVPSFMDQFSSAIDPTSDQNLDLDWGDGREVRVAYRADSGWTALVAARYGKTNGSNLWHDRRELGARGCGRSQSFCDYFVESGGSGVGGPSGNIDGYIFRYNYTNASVANREEHTIVDFTVGKDMGLGGLGDLLTSTVAGGVRYTQLGSTTRIDIYGNTNWSFPADENLIKYANDPTAFTHDHYELHADVDREFKGAGPILSWEVSKALFGSESNGVLGADWSVSGGVLFGKRETKLTGEEEHEFFAYSSVPIQQILVDPVPDETDVTDIGFSRSDNVTVPMLGMTLGLSYRVDRFNIGAGYRWERYFDALDVGYTDAKDADRTIDGPYFKLSVGFGGS